MQPQPPRVTLVWTAAAALALLGGCDRKDPIQTYRAPKEPPATVAATSTADAATADSATTDRAPDRTKGPPPMTSAEGLPAGHPPVDAADLTRRVPSAPAVSADAKPADARPADANALAWDLPAGWSALPGQGMRFATLHAADDPPLNAAVFSFPAPQNVLSNVNRWEGELKLPPTAEGDLPKVVKGVETAGGTAQVVDLAGSSERTLGAMLTHGPSVWFIKLRGPAGAVEAQKANFEALVKSLRFGAGARGGSGTPLTSGDTPRSTPPAGAAAFTKLESWKTPAGWVQDDPQPMRVVSFHTGDANAGNGGASILVTRFAADGFGPVLENLNRWRREAGLPPVEDAAEVKPQVVKVGGNSGELYDFANPKAGGQADGDRGRRVVVAMVPIGERVWFFKLIGPAGVVDQQRANFDAFLSSVKFAGE